MIIVWLKDKWAVRFLSHGNYELVAEDEATPFRTERAAALACQYAGITWEDYALKPLTPVNTNK